VFASREDANKVLDDMHKLIENYGTVTVCDLYDLCGMVGSFTDNKYGWSDLKFATVLRKRQGYELYLSNPEELLDCSVSDDYLYPAMHTYTDGDAESATLIFPNKDDNSKYIKQIGTTINIFGSFKKVISVKFTVDNVTIELR
jgi:hypothetical protein